MFSEPLSSWCWPLAGLVEGVLAVEDAVRHVEVMGDYLVFANPCKFSHQRFSFTG